MLCALILHTEWKKGRNLVHSGVAGKLSAACVFSVVHAYLVVCVCYFHCLVPVSCLVVGQRAQTDMVECDEW